MTDEEESTDHTFEPMDIECEKDMEPRVYLLVMPVKNENGAGYAVRPRMIPKKLYVTLVTKMNNANLVISEALKNGEDIESLSVKHRIIEAITEKIEGENETQDIDLQVKKRYDMMYQ